jgi:hypothetical protein
MPFDPSRQWLAAGITGLARHREWDAVATVDAPGVAGDEVEFVALPDGRVLVEATTSELDPAPLAGALAGSLESPYRALAVRRPELWVVGALALDVVELAADARGDSVEVVRDDAGLRVRVDGLPSLDAFRELERIGAARAPSYVVRAQRLDGALFEVEVEAL